MPSGWLSCAKWISKLCQVDFQVVPSGFPRCAKWMTKLVGLELQCDWVVQRRLRPPTWFHIFTHFQSISKWNGARATNTTNTICQQLVGDNTVVALCSTSHQPTWLWVRPTETGAEDLTYLPTNQPTSLSVATRPGWGITGGQFFIQLVLRNSRKWSLY